MAGIAWLPLLENAVYTQCLRQFLEPIPQQTGRQRMSSTQGDTSQLARQWGREPALSGQAASRPAAADHGGAAPETAYPHSVTTTHPVQPRQSPCCARDATRLLPLAAAREAMAGSKPTSSKLLLP